MRRQLQIIVGMLWIGCALAEPAWVPPPQEDAALVYAEHLAAAIQRPQMFHVTTSMIKTERAANGNMLLSFTVSRIAASAEWFADLKRLFDRNAIPIVYRQATTADRVVQWVFGLVPFYAAGKQYAQVIGNKLNEAEQPQPDLCFQGGNEHALDCYAVPDAKRLLPLFNRGYLVVRLISNGTVLEDIALTDYRIPLLTSVGVEEPFTAAGRPSLNQFLLVGPGEVMRPITVDLHRPDLPEGLVMDVVLAFDSGNYFTR